MANYKIYGRAIYFGLFTINRTFTSGGDAHEWFMKHQRGWRAKHSFCGVFYDRYLMKPMIEGSEVVRYASLGNQAMYNLLTDSQYD